MKFDVAFNGGREEQSPFSWMCGIRQEIPLAFEFYGPRLRLGAWSWARLRWLRIGAISWARVRTWSRVWWQRPGSRNRRIVFLTSCTGSLRPTIRAQRSRRDF
jgi:hypothetical protein